MTSLEEIGSRAQKLLKRVRVVRPPVDVQRLLPIWRYESSLRNSMVTAQASWSSEKTDPQ